MRGFYLKLGQVLASKGDILPAPYCREMSRLFGDLPPVPFEAIKNTVEFELDIDHLDDVFESFDPDPVAVGTIAQVHRATLLPTKDDVGGVGRVVAVKVPKPDVERELLADLSAMRRAAELVDALGLELGFDSASILREYQAQVPLEFDFDREARVMLHAAHSLERGPPSSIRAVLLQSERENQGQGGGASGRVLDGSAMRWTGSCVVPKPLPEFCAPGLIVMEWAPGQVMTEVTRWGDPSTLPPPAECRRTVTALLQALGQQIFVDRCFNSDPHPGNIIIDAASGKLRLLDFGQSKEISLEQCERVAWLVMALAGRCDEKVAEAVGEAGVIITDISRGESGAGSAKKSPRRNAQESPASKKERERQERRRLRRRPSGGDTGDGGDGGEAGGSSGRDNSDVGNEGIGSGSAGIHSKQTVLSGGDSSRGAAAAVGLPPAAANAAACAYILFDTRMDIPQARAGTELLDLSRTTAVSHFPEELFMVMRVVTIIRGILGTMHVDVSAAKIWEPWARHALGLLPDVPDEDHANASEETGWRHALAPATRVESGLSSSVSGGENQRDSIDHVVWESFLSDELVVDGSQLASGQSLGRSHGVPRRLCGHAVEDQGFAFL